MAIAKPFGSFASLWKAADAAARDGPDRYYETVYVAMETFINLWTSDDTVALPHLQVYSYRKVLSLLLGSSYGKDVVSHALPLKFIDNWVQKLSVVVLCASESRALRRIVLERSFGFLTQVITVVTIAMERALRSQEETGIPYDPTSELHPIC
ncbi:hypothetical protein M427DRAFT_36104 [Gonapodya prolifera JEL478]|uniref:Uncharacterized protein n=1 Tax=Gonapodya prolifera (strain JEL478) TaxID=1344416 RepID=A0A139A406_GONPJ|nr:hypothetical protein M427DRAFT_36104 [Gonapodya prolifera JEL478]|eukprot:KXS11195.1 hypothetical protein M427DRAFT_36104 [Gonapodya prolifera JEL478]